MHWGPRQRKDWSNSKSQSNSGVTFIRVTVPRWQLTLVLEGSAAVGANNIDSPLQSVIKDMVTLMKGPTYGTVARCCKPVGQPCISQYRTSTSKQRVAVCLANLLLWMDNS